MSAVLVVRREFRPGRVWWSVVEVGTDRVLVGARSSAGEAEQWATDHGHSVVDSPRRRLNAATAEGWLSASEGAPLVRCSSPSATVSSFLPLPRPRLLKEAASCCIATRDELGRFCIGYCSPSCMRRAS